MMEKSICTIAPYLTIKTKKGMIVSGNAACIYEATRDCNLLSLLAGNLS